MTLFLGADDIVRLATTEVVLSAAHAVVSAERRDATLVVPRMDVPTSRGFFRVMPAAIDGHVGVKIMTLVEGRGTRYLVLVYSQDSGELVGALDGDEITRLRTAGTTAAAAQLLVPTPATEIGLVGTGFEASGHLRLFAEMWPLRRVTVYSRSVERRCKFAARMSASLGIRVDAADNVSQACAAADTVVIATKNTQPVVNGDDFRPYAVVLSIGSTRPDLRELDRRTLQRARLLLVDDATQVLRESGDVIDAVESAALPADLLVPMSSAVLPDERTDGRDLRVFKSVGTALQDLALAGGLLTIARERGIGRDIGELTGLKAFAQPAGGR